jgi:hypothetical protein
VHDRVRYLQIKNWRDYQHYTGRNPPWIKLHTRLLDDVGFHDLADHLKVQLMALWLVAAKYDNHIPDRVTWLERFNISHKKFDLDSLINSGFVEVVEEEIPAIAGASTLLAPRLQAASASDSVSEELKNKNIVVKEVYDYWRERLGKTDARYAKRIAPNRASKIRKRLEEFTVVELKRAIDGVAADPWADRPRNNDLTLIFRSQEHVERFIEMASGAPKAAHPCARCGMGFRTGALLNDHMENVHHVWEAA